MLLEFKIKNYLSIKDELTFSMRAPSKTNHLESIIDHGKDQGYTTGLITGANASGKSALIEGMITALATLRNCTYFQPGMNIPRIVPFKFDEVSLNSNTHFGFIFIADSIKYEYNFELNSHKIVSESLYKYTSAKKSMIFERSNTNDYVFPQHLRSSLNDIKNKNTDNKLFLSTASNWNCQETIIPFKWLINNIEIFHSFIPNPSYIIPEDIKTKKFILGILKAADLNIVDYSVKRQRIIYNDIQSKEIQTFNKEVGTVIYNEKETFVNVITTFHKIKNKDGKESLLPLDLREESAGTQKMFYIALTLNGILKGKTIIVDEIEKELHSHLVEFIIKLFNTQETNPNRSQLIFSTHSRTLINDDLFDHEQINFMEKEEHTGTTTLYKLSDFSIRNNLNIEKGYNVGRFGAVPFIKYPGIF